MTNYSETLTMLDSYFCFSSVDYFFLMVVLFLFAKLWVIKNG